MKNDTTILLTIDVEDWFQVENLRPWYEPAAWEDQQPRVEQNTVRLLDLFTSLDINIKATFFVLGWVAKKYPRLVREIESRGHEVASHGFNHLMCNQIAPDALKDDLERSKKLLEDITGHRISGYRAPNFSVNDFVLETIFKAGYKYDSSYNDFSRHERYGSITTSKLSKNRIAYDIGSGCFELPISNLKIGKFILPWGGGGYFRFLPSMIFNYGVKKIVNKEQAYMFYMHPWEIDPQQPRNHNIPGLSAWKHYLNLDRTFSRLKKMIQTFKGCSYLTCSQYLSL
jgi:polysaccharide deacetylase family protein (PEP-CTERM system associated)